MRALTEYENIYCGSFLDCCRKEKPKEEKARSAATDAVEEDLKPSIGSGWFEVYTCEEAQATKYDSTFAEDLYLAFKSWAEKYGNPIVLPELCMYHLKCSTGKPKV